MNSTRQTRLVAARENREWGRSRAFLAFLILMVVGVGAVIVLPGLLDKGPGIRGVGVTGTVPSGLPRASRTHGDDLDTTIRIHASLSVADLRGPCVTATSTSS
jgi:hypothetical protein